MNFNGSMTNNETQRTHLKFQTESSKMPAAFKSNSQKINVKWSTSHLTNNLAISRATDSRHALILGTSHKTGFSMATAAEDGVAQIQSQVISKSVESDDKKPGNENDARHTAHIVQAAFVSLPTRDLLVLACTKSVQIYEPDGTVLLLIYSIDKFPRNRTETSIYTRGITGISSNLLCVGNHQGEIFIFVVPPSGSNLQYKETMPGHQHGITALASNQSFLLSSDTGGTIIIWSVRPLLQIRTISSTDSSGVTSLAVWDNCLLAAYANGMIQMFDIENGSICGSISAHARCINAIDCNDNGYLVSVGDDSFIRMWRLSGGVDDLSIKHHLNHRIENYQLVGVKFLNLSRNDIAVSAYDTNEITILRS